MCGRYASSRRPEDLAEEFEIDRATLRDRRPSRWSRTSTSRPPSRSTPSCTRPPTTSGPSRAAAAGAALGPGAVLGQGPGDRQPDDQRPDGDRRREAGVPAGLRAAAVPAARGRLLRVVPDRAEDQGRQAAQAAVLHPPDGRPVLAMAGLYEIWRDPTRDDDDPERFRWTCTVLTTTAEDAVGHIHDRMPLLVEPERYAAWLDPSRTDPDELSAAAGARRAGPARGLPGLDRRSTASATTVPSSSSRCRGGPDDPCDRAGSA